MTKAPTPTEKSKEKRDNKKKNGHKKVEYTTISDRFRTVIWSNDSHQTGVVKTVHGIPTFSLTKKAV